MSDIERAEQAAQQRLQAAQALKQQIGVVIVTSDLEYQAAGQAILKLKDDIKAAEEERKSWVEPLNKIVKRLNSIYKPVIEEWESIVDGLKFAMLTYQKAVQAEKDRAMEAARQLALQGASTGSGVNVQQYQALVAQGSAGPPKAAGIGQRENWVWRVTDASKVPAEYLMTVVNVEKVNAAVKANKGQTNIPGIAVENQPILIARG